MIDGQPIGFFSSCHWTSKWQFQRHTTYKGISIYFLVKIYGSKQLMWQNVRKRIEKKKKKEKKKTFLALHFTDATATWRRWKDSQIMIICDIAVIIIPIGTAYMDITHWYENSKWMHNQSSVGRSSVIKSSIYLQLCSQGTHELKLSVTLKVHQTLVMHQLLFLNKW